MELEVQWWNGQLAGDIYRSLRYRELTLPSYTGQSPQIGVRRYFADLIAITSNRFRLCPTARHLAVYLLDLIMDRYDISLQQLHVVAFSCLLLAAKFEEKEDRVPKLDMLNSLDCMSSINLVLTKHSVLQMELRLLQTLQWNLYLPTAAHFIEYYLSIAVHESDLHGGWPVIHLEKARIYVVKYAYYFLEMSLQDQVFLNYVPSLVAAACVASARIVQHMSPAWPARLKQLTMYSWSHLVLCIERLLFSHDSNMKEITRLKHPHLQPNPLPSQLLFAVPVHVTTMSHFLPLSTQRLPQQTGQPIPGPTHGSAVMPRPIARQTGAHSRVHHQVVGQTHPMPQAPKSSVPATRSFQLKAHYTYTLPHFGS